eukprot:scaffold24583_cov20-Prasinocladus_malaysianus.AAC.1
MKGLMQFLHRRVHIIGASGSQPSSQLTIGVGTSALLYEHVKHGATSDAVGRPLVLLNIG